ncbi:hypothetical protein CAJAP_10237 [Camponotus japonicus]
MDARRALPFLLLVICAISAASIIRNGRDGRNNIRRIRRINLSEYLVPPPPTRLHPPGRVARLVSPPPTEVPGGYFSQFINWLNPFASSETLLPPPPPPPYTETPYPPKLSFVSPKFVPPSAPVEVYGGPSPTTYDKPPPPPSSYSEYPPANKVKNCNPCNKEPWIPIQHGEFSHSGVTSFVPPPPPLLDGRYLPPRNHERPHDAYHAASQEVRAASQEVRPADFSFALPLPSGQDGSVINPLPNPHLYPGAIPPLYKAEIFNYSVEAVSNSNSEYLDAPPASSPAFEDVPSTGNVSFPGSAGFNFNSGASVYPHPSNSDRGAIHQEYINPGASNEELDYFNPQNYVAHGDLSPSDTQISHGHSNLIPNQQRLENTATQSSFDSISHQTSFDNSDVSIDQNLSSGYGISGLDQIPGNLEHQYNDLSSSANVAEDSRAPLRVTDGSSAKSEDSIHFEESPLLDFTDKDESRTDSSSIPPTSNAFTDSTNTEAVGTTLTHDDEVYGTRHDITATESYFPEDHFQTIKFVTPSEESKINDTTTQDSNGGLRDNKILRGQDVSYIPPSDQVGYLWPSVLSTTSRNTESRKYWPSVKPLLNTFDDAEETLNENINVKSKDANKTSTKLNDKKKNKQVQVIIPYTSQYTPLPFHSSHDSNHEQKALNFTRESNHDYFVEESRRNVKVTSLPNSSYTWNISTLLEDIIRKPVGIKVNNSIDVHKLQKNIDNWTIQEYSKGTTASTISSSSVNPYLFPSKQIPDKYLTTTESVNSAVGPYNDNVKTFTLAGFSFNDLDYKGSASEHVEGQRVKMTENSKSESSTEASTSTKNDLIWQGFSVDISPVNKERIYVVTPLPYNVTTPKSNSVDKKKEKATKEADRNSKVLETDTNRTKNKSNTFELIEKAYQVLPQAVNNLAVASTGPESVPLWGIMEHEEFAMLNENEHESEDSESFESPVLYAGHSKVSRARR